MRGAVCPNPDPDPDPNLNPNPNPDPNPNPNPNQVPYASPHTVCPAGSISPGSAADWPRLHAQHSFLASLSSADHPEVSANQLHQELALRKSTMRVSLIGGSSFVAFLVLLGAAGLFRPRIAAALLRTMDVPPISGAPTRTNPTSDPNPDPDPDL